MIIRHKRLPDLEFEVSTDDEARLAHRVIEAMTGDCGKRAHQETLPCAPPSLPPTIDPEESSPGTSGPSGLDRPRFNVKRVIAVMGQILWSYDIPVLRAIKAERTRRKVVEGQLAGHSFNKFAPRLRKAAEAAGGELEDFLLVEKLGEGLARETWFAAGPMLEAISMEELERLEAQLKGKEEEKRASKE